MIDRIDKTPVLYSIPRSFEAVWNNRTVVLILAAAVVAIAIVYKVVKSWKRQAPLVQKFCDEYRSNTSAQAAQRIFHIGIRAHYQVVSMLVTVDTAGGPHKVQYINATPKMKLDLGVLARVVIRDLLKIATGDILSEDANVSVVPNSQFTIPDFADALTSTMSDNPDTTSS